MIDIVEYLQSKPYPGRGIMVGCSKDGQRRVVAYFIMGRSENSRNRVFELTEDGIRTKAFDESKMSDPSLIIYHPVRCMNDGSLVVTNGDQTDTVVNLMAEGASFEEALATRTFEPDGPNWTPRISAIVLPDGSYRLSILKSLDGDDACACRYGFSYETPQNGQAHFISTYAGDGDPCPSFGGEPLHVELPTDDIDELAQMLWSALNNDNKVSLYVCSLDYKTGEIAQTIVNKYIEEA